MKVIALTIALMFPAIVMADNFSIFPDEPASVPVVPDHEPVPAPERKATADIVIASDYMIASVLRPQLKTRTRTPVRKRKVRTTPVPAGWAGPSAPPPMPDTPRQARKVSRVANMTMPTGMPMYLEDDPTDSLMIDSSGRLIQGAYIDHSVYTGQRYAAPSYSSTQRRYTIPMQNYMPAPPAMVSSSGCSGGGCSSGGCSSGGCSGGSCNR